MNTSLTPKISIIVPVYKAEKYIRRCLDSILYQTYEDFEVILVDDGSPDKSGEICDEYAQKEKRIRVIHKVNGGVASARQCGIDNVRGVYTMHIDPDDWIEHNTLERMYSKIIETDSDLLIADYYINSKDKEIYEKETISNLNNEAILKGILYGNNCCLWNKLIKTDIYKKNKINFIKDIDYGEDFLFLIQVLQTKRLKITYLQEAFYHYDIYINNNSLTRKKDKNISNIADKYISSVEQLIPNKYIKEKQIYLINFIAFCFFTNSITPLYKYHFNNYRDGIKNIRYSTMNTIIFRLSYYNKDLAHSLYILKKEIHLLMHKLLNISN